MARRRMQSLLPFMVAVTALAILMAPFARARVPKADATQQLQSLATQVAEAVKAGDYLAGIPPAQQALQLARKTFGNRDPRILASLVSLAQIYQLSGRSEEAEPLFREAEPLFRKLVQTSREKLGPHHLQTLDNIVGLAQLYQLLGRYDEAESLFREALQISRKKLGPRQLLTLTSIVGLAQDYQLLSRNSEAEPLFREAVQISRETLGPRNPQTLMSIDGLAQVYQALSRYDEGEPLFQEALQARREMLGARHPGTLTSLYLLASFYDSWGRYEQAEPLYAEALQASRETLGPRHPETLRSITGLADVYRSLGRWEQAEPLYREVLQANRETLGDHNVKTLPALNNLASFYLLAGRLEEAEPLFQEVLQERRNALGAPHPDTVGSLNALAFLYAMQGRYAEAEPLLREALQATSETPGPHDSLTVMSLLGLGLVLQSKGRYGEAELRYREALQVSREAFGPHNLSVLLSLNRLASIYVDERRYSEAEQLYRDALQVSRETFGSRHLSTLLSLGTLASIYRVQRRYSEAEPLLVEALQSSREVLGPRDPNTLISLGALADLYQAQGRYAEADQLYSEALQADLEVLGVRNPQTLKLQLNSAMLRVNQGRSAEAVRQLQQMEPHLLEWIGQELYSTEAGTARRQLVSSQATFQDVVLTLATAENRGEVRRLAGNVILRFKLLQSEEESYLAHLTRRSQDPRVQSLAGEVGKLRAAVVGAARAEPSAFDKALQVLEAKQPAARVEPGAFDKALQALEAKQPAARTEPGAFEKALQALEAKQRELGKLSRVFEDHLRVRNANIEDLRAWVPAGAVLMEFREFRPVDFRTGTPGEPRFAAMLLAGSDDPVVADLGPISAVGQPAALNDEAAAALYGRLFAPFEQKLTAATTIYVAPDGILNLVPFARLKLADGRYWGQRQEVRVLQSGRDLLRADPDKQARGLVAMGGIDFGIPAAEAKNPSGVLYAAANSGAVTRAAGSFRFAQLAASGEEAMEVKEWYQRLRKEEPAEVWSGTDASKARLMAMKSPPRVLHLATHGFYLANETRDPMLQSGVALAGANRALAEGGGGMLFALEAQGLNLEGTELVVLSACDTAQGSLDYSEGVYGLVRALRLAGARNVLVTLWPVKDDEARDFMVTFYKNWLNQVRSDPAKALRDTQLSYLKQDKLRDPRVWAPYILIE